MPLTPTQEMRALEILRLLVAPNPDIPLVIDKAQKFMSELEAAASRAAGGGRD